MAHWPLIIRAGIIEPMTNLRNDKVAALRQRRSLVFCSLLVTAALFPQAAASESRDRSIDHRGTYWGDFAAARSQQAYEPEKPLKNFINDPNSHLYKDWGRSTFFDRGKRLAPTLEQDRDDRGAGFTFMKLKF